MNWAAIIWLSLMVVFLIAEAGCPVHLISIWFAVGSLTAMIVSLLGGQIWLQVLLFFLVSSALLALLWPFVRKFMNPRLVKTNVDSIVGSTGVVTQAIENLSAKGQVKLGAMYWTARSTSGERIDENTVIRVDRIEGVKVFVSPAESKVTM